MKKVFLAIVSSFLVFACSDIDSCNNDSNQTFMVLRFFDIKTKESKKVGFRVSANHNEALFGLSNDSLAIGLPLDLLDTATAFFFDSDTNDYSLQVRFDKEFSLFDPACDPSWTFVGLDTLSSTFDSTAVTGRVTNRQLATNIEVYF